MLTITLNVYMSSVLGSLLVHLFQQHMWLLINTENNPIMLQHSTKNCAYSDTFTMEVYEKKSLFLVNHLYSFFPYKIFFFKLRDELIIFCANCCAT